MEAWQLSMIAMIVVLIVFALLTFWALMSKNVAHKGLKAHKS
jgi:hypothetical protein